MGGTTSKIDLNGNFYTVPLDKEYDTRKYLFKQRIELNLELLYMNGYIEMNITDIMVSGYDVLFKAKDVYENLKKNIPKPFTHTIVCEHDEIYLRICLINLI